MMPCEANRRSLPDTASRKRSLIGFSEWQRLSQVPSFGRLLMAAPITPNDLPVRDSSPLRDADL